MIGNDIIDLAYTRKHNDWTRKGFLNKIFTLKEQSYIAQSKDPFYTVWRLWSMKESVYKLHLRSKQERSFYPSKISCELIDDNRGLVSQDAVTYITTTNTSETHIFTFASHKISKEVYHDIIEYDKKLPENYYKLIKNKIAIHLGCNPAQIDIIKNKIGIPQLYFDKVKSNADISITHHGKFLAWSLIQ